MSFIIREAIRFATNRGRHLISTGFALGVLVTGVVAFGLLGLAGHLHSRKSRSREAHPSMGVTAAGSSSPDEASSTPDSIGAIVDDQEPVPATLVGTEATDAREIAATQDARQHITAHRGIPELIHALGPEQVSGGDDSVTMRPVASVFALPERFDAFVTQVGRLDLESLFMGVLRDTGYEVHPERGDLIAARGHERLLIRALPWDGTFVTVGRRTVERFADDFDASGATDGICITEAAMPDLAASLESANAGLWFVGRHRLARFLELIDGALAFGSPTSPGAPETSA